MAMSTGNTAVSQGDCDESPPDEGNGHRYDFSVFASSKTVAAMLLGGDAIVGIGREPWRPVDSGIAPNGHGRNAARSARCGRVGLVP